MAAQKQRWKNYRKSSRESNLPSQHFEKCTPLSPSSPCQVDCSTRHFWHRDRGKNSEVHRRFAQRHWADPKRCRSRSLSTADNLLRLNHVDERCQSPVQKGSRREGYERHSGMGTRPWLLRLNSWSNFTVSHIVIHRLKRYKRAVEKSSYKSLW